MNADSLYSPQGRPRGHHHQREICREEGKITAHLVNLLWQEWFEDSADVDLISRQVVIIQPLDTGSKSHPFPHALVAGIERYPSSVTRRMSKTRQAKRSKVKPFIKTINYNHLMPTRYTLELEGLKGVITNDTFKEVTQREEAKKVVKKTMEERYTSGKNRWFFTQLSKNSIPNGLEKELAKIPEGF